MGNPAVKAEPIDTRNLVWDKAEQVVKSGVAARKGNSMVLTVSEVKDADTVELKGTGGKSGLVCRLDGIDAQETAKPWQSPPDPGQAYGESAKKELLRMIDQKEVNVTVTKAKDAHGRAVCQIDINGNNVNAELVKAGAAFLTEKFWKDPPESVQQIGQREALRVMQKNAQDRKLGVFSLPISDQGEPYQHRRTQKALQEAFRRNQ